MRTVSPTDAYPALIARDAQMWLSDYRQNRRGHTGLGFLAAWAADEYRRGKQAQVARFLAAADRRQQLVADRPALWKGGLAYIRALARFLDRNGYG